MTESTKVDMSGIKRHTTCTSAGPLFVHSKNGKIVRVEPMQFNPEEVDSWEVEVNGKIYKPPLTHPVLPWGLAGKQFQYSENRVLYPMKRVDWNPDGERNPEKRGISGYERISWDEAYDIIEKEMNRIKDTYGPSAFGWSHSAHPEWGSLHYFFSDSYRFWDMIGATYRQTTPISWEGWACGATLLWGSWFTHGLLTVEDTLQDVSENSEVILIWGTEPLMHDAYAGIATGRTWQYWKELGKQVILIDPFNNEAGVAAADKWIPIYPGTDVALAAAIAYIWITEGTYDQAYLDTHTIGFDEEHMPEGVPEGLSLKTYILGKSADGIPKTPEWASAICGVPVRTIKDLAHLWVAKPTALWAMLGGACRRQSAHEYTRMISILQIMQGLGKPGVSIHPGGLGISGPYDGMAQLGPTGYADGGMNCVLDDYRLNSVSQTITFQKFLDCLEKPPQTWHGGNLDVHDADMFFKEVEYPEPGCSEVHFLWQRGSTLNPPDHKRDIRAYRNRKIETFVVAAPWFERDCRYADLVLPATTIFERQDMTEPSAVGQYIPSSYIGLRSAVFHQKVVEPLGESKTDMQICADLAKRLGYEEIYLEGNTEETLLQKMYNKTNIPMTYDDFKEKGYYVWPAPENYQPKKQLTDFYNDPESYPLDTPTGKMEIFSTLVYEQYGYNEEIPPVPHYIPEKEGHESKELREKYPFQMLTSHPKFRFHGKYNDCEWLCENYKVCGPDDYRYEPVWMNSKDAAARNLADGDIVQVFNDRGKVLAGLRVTERMMPGVVWLTYGSWNDPLSAEADSLDRSGDANVLSNAGPMSVHHVGGAFNSNLIEIEKADLENLAMQYPEGWAGKYRTWNREG